MNEEWLDSLIPREPEETEKIQNILARRVRIIPLRKSPNFIAAVDASFLGDMVIAVASLFTYPEMEQLEDSVFKGVTTFPYIPGFLSFREGSALVKAVAGLRRRPDVLLVDGHGISHPRGIGIASHIGVILDLPTIGCAKSRLIGEFREPEKIKGNWTYLFQDDGHGKRIGAVVRTRSGVKPLFVSPGHLIDIESSIKVVLDCASHYRIPDPLRRADQVSKSLKRMEETGKSGGVS
jgi:deoxyribonuclease V